MKINLSDGNAYESYETLEEAIKQASTWYDYIQNDKDTEWYGKDLPAMRTTGITNVDDLNEAITEWEANLADGEGKSDFYGHGSYHVSSAHQAGYCLVASEDLEDDVIYLVMFNAGMDGCFHPSVDVETEYHSTNEHNRCIYFVTVGADDCEEFEEYMESAPCVMCYEK